MVVLRTVWATVWSTVGATIGATVERVDGAVAEAKAEVSPTVRSPGLAHSSSLSDLFRWLSTPTTAPVTTMELDETALKNVLASGDSKLLGAVSPLGLHDDGDDETIEAASGLARLAIARTSAPLKSPLGSQSQQELERILRQCEQRLNERPESARTWFQQGQVLSRLGQYRHALASYDHALRLRVDWADAWYARATVLRLLGLGKQAFSSLYLAQAYQVQRDEAKARSGSVGSGSVGSGSVGSGQSTSLSPYESAYAWFTQGRAWFNLQEYNQALHAFVQAAACPTLAAEAWHYHGRTLRRMGSYREAIASFDRSLGLNPQDGSLWNNRGVAFYNLGCYEDAIASFNRAIAMDPTLSRAWYNKARCYALQHNYGCALQNLHHALQFNAKTYLSLAQVDDDFAQLRQHRPEQWHQLLQQVPL